MRLLIITQKADRADPILGFFHRWLEEFGKKCEQVTVIAQSSGECALPENVTVVSMGKEAGRSKMMQIVRFWMMSWKLRRDYDAVFVHMTPIWVILGAPLWMLLRRPVYLWYEIKRGGWKLATAVLCVRKVFCATAHGMPKAHGKMVVTGHGIDTEMFRPEAGVRERNLISSISRITPIKRIDVLVRAFARLPAEYFFVIAGGPITDADEAEVLKLKALITELGLSERVRMTGPIVHEEARRLLQRSALLLHACGGGLDKIVLEAMACGTLVVSSSEAAKSVLPLVLHATEETMGERVQAVMGMNAEERETWGMGLRRIVEREHGLVRLIERLKAEMGEM